MASRKIEVQILGDSKSLERAFARSGKAGKTFGKDIGVASRHIAGSIAAIGAAVAVGVGVKSVKSLTKFQESMERIVGLAGGSQKAVSKFADEILKLGPEVAKGPQELGDALYFVASAGIAVKDQMQVVRTSAKASTAGLGETGSVADAVTSAMNAYGASVLNASQATDVLVATVREGKGEAAAFAPVIGTVASIASQLGVSFEEVGAALAAQTRLGVSAETAAVQLQAVFSSLLKDTPKTSKALGKVGLSLKGLQAELKGQGLLAVLKTLKKSFGDNTAAMAEAFPNIRALRGLLGLVGKNAEEVRGVFDRMRNSTGALDTAFKAVSKGTAFQFKQAMAGLATAGIQLGAIFAPVANKIAQGTNAALEVVNDFLHDLGKARTVRAKIRVVWEGITNAAKRLQELLGDVVRKIDFDKVWAEAQGIADGLQASLEKVDFAFVGERIGKSIRKSVEAALPAAKEIGSRLTNAIDAIDFSGLGRKLGPELAAAVVSGFLTLLDPGFWIKNWDLALGVTLVAFSGPIGRLAGKLAPFFVRLGNRVVVSVAVGIAKFAPRLADVFLAVVERLPGLLVKALSPLTGKVKAIFKRLGRLATFAAKVTGLTVAINAVKDFAQSVGRIFKNVGSTIKNVFERFFNFLKKRAIKAALEIIEPFTHIPRKLGGGTFQDLKTQWKATLAAMETSTDSSVRTIQSSIDGLHGKNIVVTLSPQITGRDTGGHEQPRTTGGLTVKDAVDEATKDKKNADTIANTAEERAKAAKAAARRAARAKKQTIAAFDKLMGGLSLDLDRAGSTKSFADDLKILNLQKDAVLREIKVEGKTLELQQTLLDIENQITDTRKKRQERQTDLRKSKQFQKFGLTATGDKITPSVGALGKRVSTLKQQIAGTILDTPKTAKTLRQITAVLRGKFGKVGADVRQAILGMLNDISGALDSSGQKGPLTKFAKKGVEDLIAGLGLTAEQVKVLRSRMSQLGPGGAAPGRGSGGAFGFGVSSSGEVIVVNTTVNLDGNVVAKNTTKHQQKTKGRNPPPRRGPRR